MALVQVLLQITSLLLLDGFCLLGSAAFKINTKGCQLLAEVSNGIREPWLPLLLAQPRSEGLCCQHTRPGRGLSTTGELVPGASLEPVGSLWWILPGDVCCSVTALAGGGFFKPADSRTTGTVWCHRTTQAVAFPSSNDWQWLLEVDAPAKVEVAFMVKAQAPPKRRKVIKLHLIGFV